MGYGGKGKGWGMDMWSMGGKGMGGFGKGGWGMDFGKGWGGMNWGKGWGKGGGYGRGYGGGRGRAPPKNTVPEDFEIAPDRLFVGTVESYYKFNGYGFITLDETGVIPDDKVFVHWQALTSADRYPTLVKDMKVQFSVAKVIKGGVTTLNATNVTLPGGNPIALQDAADAEKKTFVGAQNLRYTGTMKFYIPKQVYGYIQIDEGFQYGDEPVPRDIRAESAEMNAGGANAGYMKDVKVEFGIWKTQKGVYKAYNVTLPGGLCLPPEEPTPPEPSPEAEGGLL